MSAGVTVSVRFLGAVLGDNTRNSFRASALVWEVMDSPKVADLSEVLTIG
jgi:hypothetical protein